MMKAKFFLGLPLALALWCAWVTPAAAAGTIIAWGYTNDTQGNYAGVLNPPTELTNAIRISAGAAHSLALDQSGLIGAWGANGYGEATLPGGLSNVIEVAAGYFHNLALKTDGTVVAWGSNVSGETNVPPGLSNVVAIAANGCDCLPNGNKSLALKADGTVIGWGATTVPVGMSNVVAISAGGNHALALDQNGNVSGWGSNASGQSTTPPGLSNVVAIAAGGSHSMALRMDGTVRVWGNNSYGQTNPPAGLSNVVAIAAGQNFCLALRDNGTVAAWGYNFGGATDIPTGLSNVVAIAGGWLHSVAIFNDGTPVIVRQPLSQTLFSGETATLSAGAVGAPPLSYQWQLNGVNLTAATNATLILPQVQPSDSGNYTLIVSNALGVSTNANATLSVIATAPIITIQPTNTQSSFGNSATFAVAAVGSVPLRYQWQKEGVSILTATNASLTLSNLGFAAAGNYSAWVSNSIGATLSANAALTLTPVVAWGAGTVNSNLSPHYGQSRIPAGLSNVMALAGGGYHSLALKSDGRVVAWGWNGIGQTNVPTTLTNAVAIAAGLRHSAALRSNGTVTAWGDSSYSLTFPPSSVTNVIALSAGWYHNLALRSNGTLVAWGAGTITSTSPHFGQSLIPNGLSNVIAVAAGGYHNLALKQDGTVSAWGWNLSGQTNVPPWLSNVVAVAAGGSNSLALKTDGTLAAWGDNTFGQTNIPVGLSNVVAISAGAAHQMALRSDGTLVVWGLNGHGQTNVSAGLTNLMAVAAGGFHSLGLVNLGPVGFLNHPRSQIVLKESPVTFNATALGAPPLRCQWQFNSADLPHETNTQFTISNAQLAHTGSYRLVVSNAYGAATSAVAQLTVNDPAPTFVLHPTNQFVLANTQALFAAQVVGVTPISYQWRRDGTNLMGQTNSSLVLSNVTFASEGFYSVAASNAFGVATSAAAFLNVLDLPEALNATNLTWSASTNPPWVIQRQLTHDGQAAVSITTAIPGAGSLQTLAVGPGTLTFWWRMNGFSLADSLTIYLNGQLAAQPTFLLNQWEKRTLYLPTGTNLLEWRFSGSSASTVGYLDEVTLTPGPTPPLLTTIISSRTVPAGTNVTFTIGTGGTPPLAYQWQFAGTNLIGATNASLSLVNVQPANSGSYQVIITNAYGSTNSSALLTVTNSAPVILTAPTAKEMVRGGTVVFEVAARGSDPLTYQWQFEAVDLPGATNTSLRLSQIQPEHAGNYRVVITNAFGTAISTPVSLTLVPTVIVGWGSVFTSSPNPPLGLTNVAAISGGDNYSVALRTDGTVYAWGWDAFSRLNVPAGLSNVAQISAGGFHSSTLLTNGTVVNWGHSFSDSSVNVPAGLSNVVDIAAGFRFNLALKRDNSVQAWGENSLGPLNLPTPLTNVVAFGAGQYHGLAVKRDGTVAGWGYYTSGQTNVPPTATNVVAVDAGYTYSLALRRDGSVLSWGSGAATNLPNDLTNAIAIAAGWYHGLALRDDGTVSAWGQSSSGQATAPDWLTNVVAISAGSQHSLALLNDGSPYITRQPWTQTISPGETVSFDVVALGQSPRAYQWFYNQAPLPGATNASLILSNTPLTSAGIYHCVVTNSIGSVTSLPAWLTVPRTVPQFVAAGFGINGGNTFGLRLNGMSGHGPIILYASSNLVHWEPILTNAPATGQILLQDPEPDTWPQRFYKVVEE